MIDLGPHAVFIISSYLGTTLVVALLIFWVWYNSRRQHSRLANLEARGIHRRSDASADQQLKQT